MNLSRQIGSRTMRMNPYHVLGLAPEATKVEIARAGPAALAARQFNAREIAEAQKILLDTEKRIIVDMMLFKLPPTQRPKRLSFSKEELSPVAPEIENDRMFDMVEKLAGLVDRMTCLEE